MVNVTIRDMTAGRDIKISESTGMAPHLLDHGRQQPSGSLPALSGRAMMPLAALAIAMVLLTLVMLALLAPSQVPAVAAALANLIRAVLAH